MNTQNVLVLYAELSEYLLTDDYLSYMGDLPDFMQQQINKYINIRERKISSAGKGLLATGLDLLNLGGYEALDKFRVDAKNRPYLQGIPEFIDFNISHSKDMVVCAFSKKSRLGIDIEYKDKDINLSDFKHLLSTDQWDSLEENPNYIDQFYQYWSQKEAVAKADGRGLSMPFNEMEVTANRLLIDNGYWYLKNINIGNEAYSFWLATSEIPEITIYEIKL